jgi:hypothetical protein
MRVPPRAMPYGSCRYSSYAMNLLRMVRVELLSCRLSLSAGWKPFERTSSNEQVDLLGDEVVQRELPQRPSVEEVREGLIADINKLLRALKAPVQSVLVDGALAVFGVEGLLEGVLDVDVDADGRSG